jgi:toxin ParE1/3/4
MRRYRLSPAAQRDMAEIWLYSAQNWGADRADDYIRALSETMTSIAEDPLIGASCEDIRPSYRKRPSGSHTIFYKQVSTDILIIRVLHQNMDFVRNLH